jgi:hypothetical protein
MNSILEYSPCAVLMGQPALYYADCSMYANTTSNKSSKDSGASSCLNRGLKILIIAALLDSSRAPRHVYIVLPPIDVAISMSFTLWGLQKLRVQLKLVVERERVTPAI